MPVDYSKYPPNWKSEIVPRILNRENHCCKFCGIKSKSTAFSILIYAGNRGWRRVWLTNRSDVIRLQHFWPAEEMREKDVKIVLTIAHLDHDETNHSVSDDRLAALCQICHLNYDIEEKGRRRAAKEHQLDLIGE